MTVTCNDPAHEAERAALAGHDSLDCYGTDNLRSPLRHGYRACACKCHDYDAIYGTPCIICGAPIINGEGHDDGCMGLDS